MINILLEKNEQEYVSAAGQARFQDGNEKTSIAAAKRQALNALKAKGAKGIIKFHKPNKVGDKYVVVAYVGTPKKGEYDSARGGYSPTAGAAAAGKKILDKVKGRYKGNEYVEDMEDWFGTPEKWHSFLSGAKALDKAPKAKQEFESLNADLRQVMMTHRRALGAGSRGGEEKKWAFEKFKEVKAQLDKLKLAAGLASKIGYRVTLFARGKAQLPGEEERDVSRSASRAI